MPRYRIFYAEHGPANDESLSIAPEETFGGEPSNDGDSGDEEESQWEENYDANNAPGALAGFFADHAPDQSQIALVEEDGSTRAVSGAFDPDRTYIWVEEGMLMEYQGIQEATPGTVACPLCDGTGEVDEAIAEEYAEQYGSQN
ncbi:MAG: hypothetical protein ABI559_03710 [Chloroflexota bacterium]